MKLNTVHCIDIDEDEFSERVRELGGKVLVYKTLRVVAEFTHQIKLTQIKNLSIMLINLPNLQFEITKRQSFEKSKKFLESIGFTQSKYREMYVTKYLLPILGIKSISVYCWPSLRPYIEINYVDKLDKIIDILNLNPDYLRVGPIPYKYEEYYGIEKEIIESTPSITFSNTGFELFPKKNIDLFNSLTYDYLIAETYSGPP